MTTTLEQARQLTNKLKFLSGARDQDVFLALHALAFSSLAIAEAMTAKTETGPVERVADNEDWGGAS